jgi:hypothetical protein
MWIKEEVTSIQLGERLWSGAVSTWEEICNARKEEEAMQYFEDLFCDEEAIDIGTINDILWMDSDNLMEYLGLNKESKEWYISEEEFAILKENGILSDAHIGVIQESFDLCYPNVTYTELNDVEDLSDEEFEELERVVA